MINDFEYTGTFLNKISSEGLEDTPLFLFTNDNHANFITDNPLEHVLI